jgi:hypothetical protein
MLYFNYTAEKGGRGVWHFYFFIGGLAALERWQKNTASHLH